MDFWQVLCGFGWVFWNPVGGWSRTLGKSRTGVPSGVWWSGQSHRESWSVRLSWKSGSEWDEGLSFGAGRREGLGLQGKLSEESNWRDTGKAWTLMDTGKKGLTVTTEHNSSEGRQAGKEESKMSKIQRNWAGRKTGFHVLVGAQV